MAGSSGVAAGRDEQSQLLQQPVARLSAPASSFLQPLQPGHELAVLRVGQLERRLRLDDRVGVEHGGELRRPDTRCARAPGGGRR